MKSKRYTEIDINELMRVAIKLSTNERITTFIELANLQDVNRKTYLEQVRRYPTQLGNYNHLKAILEINIIEAIKTGEINKAKAVIMLWNHRK